MRFQGQQAFKRRIGTVAFIAVGAFAGIPLTRSSDASPSVAAVSVTRGHETLHDWEKLATATDTELLGFDTLQTGTDTSGRPTFLTAPRTSDRTTDTSISVRDNEIVALGGLMRDSKTLNVNKIPILGDIPILGHLFRNTTTETVKTELMIFLTPYIVAEPQQLASLTAQENSKIQVAPKEFTEQELAATGTDVRLVGAVAGERW